MKSPGDRKPATAKGGPVSQFIDTHYQHFNAAALKDAADAYIDLIAKGGMMFVSMAGAMSTGELGKSLAEMIRQGKVHGISCTGASLEESAFLLVAKDKYEKFPDYQHLSPADDQALYKRHINRVTDVGIPEQSAMAPIEDAVMKIWQRAQAHGESLFPHEPLYEILWNGSLKKHYTGNPDECWLLAAAEVNLPIFVPGWADSTLGNVFAAQCLKGQLKSSTIKGGIDYMVALAEWYREESKTRDIGFYQIAGGIPGDFAICVVPLLEQDAEEKGTKKWAYFCQITDADETYGGYSGAMPTEKITWGKIEPNTPAFCIKSDASIVCPLMFAKVLGW